MEASAPRNCKYRLYPSINKQRIFVTFVPYKIILMKTRSKNIRGLLAISPLIVFLVVYLATSLILGDFYKVPVASAFLVASVYAVLVSEGSLNERLEAFSSGAGNSKVLLMIWIFILAGAFAQTAKDIGAVDATVGLALRIVPHGMLFAGLFLTACFISLSIGTSVGTIVALVPIAAGIAESTGGSVAFMTAVIVGGAFFGDNLSFISDTTIAATKALDCEMRDKFRANLRVVIPAVIIVTAIYIIAGAGVHAETVTASIQWYKVLPYVAVLAMAMCGVNVMISLSVGIVINFAIGMATGVMGWSSWLASMGTGIEGMGSLITVTLLAGGMMELIRRGGGLDLVINGISRQAKSRRSAEFSIAALVSLANLCTANNTIAIITTGGIAKDIADRFQLDRKRVASILDTFSCLVQGLIPYGAQLLMATALSGEDAAAIISCLYYPFVLGAVSLLSILFRKG